MPAFWFARRSYCSESAYGFGVRYPYLEFPWWATATFNTKRHITEALELLPEADLLSWTRCARERKTSHSRQMVVKVDVAGRCSCYEVQMGFFFQSAGMPNLVNATGVFGR